MTLGSEPQAKMLQEAGWADQEPLPAWWEKSEPTQEHFTSSGRMELAQSSVRSGKHQEFFQTLLPINTSAELPPGRSRGGERLEQMAG